MNQLVLILHKPGLVFNQLKDDKRSVLNHKSSLIATFIGLMLGVYRIVADYDFVMEQSVWIMKIVYVVAGILIAAGLWVLYYEFIVAYILFGFGKLLGNKKGIAETRAAVNFALIPVVFVAIIGIGIELIPESLLDTANGHMFFKTTTSLIGVWALFIRVIGFKILNEYGIVKAIINALPITLTLLLIAIIY